MLTDIIKKSKAAQNKIFSYLKGIALVVITTFLGNFVKETLEQGKSCYFLYVDRL